MGSHAAAFQTKNTGRRDHGLAEVQVRDNESLEAALKRFKRQIEETGVLREAREHEHYEKPSDRRRRLAAARRRKLRMLASKR
jgi:small subunit ribosomal protein S21